MQASRFESRYLFALTALILFLGFLSPWLYFGDVLNLEARSSWLVLSSWVARTGWLTFSGAVLALLAGALLLTGLGAWMRVWGSAYAPPEVALDGDAILADGPYRHTRHPLALGAIVHTVGAALLMPPSGAIQAIVLLTALQVRVALDEEARLRTRNVTAYANYCARVPRFLPVPAAQVAAAGQPAHWLTALLSEVYFVGTFVTLAALGWDFNASPLRRGLLICLGASLVMRAFLPQAAMQEAGDD